MFYSYIELLQIVLIFKGVFCCCLNKHFLKYVLTFTNAFWFSLVRKITFSRSLWLLCIESVPWFSILLRIELILKKEKLQGSRDEWFSHHKYSCQNATHFWWLYSLKYYSLSSFIKIQNDFAYLIDMLLAYRTLDCSVGKEHGSLTKCLPSWVDEKKTPFPDNFKDSSWLSGDVQNACVMGKTLNFFLYPLLPLPST